MATILAGLRAAINDETSPYLVANTRLLRYLDSAIDALSNYVENIKHETKTITTQDITNGYFSLSSDVEHIVDFSPPKYDYYIKDNRVYFANVADWSAGQYEIEYNAYYKRFDGEDRADSYFDYPKRADFGIIMWALGAWMDEQMGLKADGSIGAISSKSENQLSISYAINGENGIITSGHQARKEARKLWARLPNVKSAVFSVSSFL